MKNFTGNEVNQDLKDNNYFSHYFFIFASKYCKSNYKLLSNNNIDDFYNQGKNCMILKGFLSNTNYFKSIAVKNCN